MKHYLKRTVGSHTLSAEEFTTVLGQVEACLNSRPIAGFSHDPDDLFYLSLGHFLIRTSLIIPTDTTALDIKSSVLMHWRFVQYCTSIIRKKVWQSDYLRSLQRRYKRLSVYNIMCK